MLVLDTHVWVWSMDSDSRRIGRRSRQLLLRAQARDAIRVSPISIFEVGALHTLGRLRLTVAVDQWVRRSLEAPGIRIAALAPAMAIDAGYIPRSALADPLDRLLVATVRHLGAAFLTADEAVLEFASKTGAVAIHDARL